MSIINLNDKTVLKRYNTHIRDGLKEVIQGDSKQETLTHVVAKYSFLYSIQLISYIIRYTYRSVIFNIIYNLCTYKFILLYIEPY